jgi:predicted MFS family arabinose efflux permease
MNGAGGLEGWRWLFILEGVPSVICGIVIFFFLPQYPESASWLNEEEKRLQLTRMGVNCSHGGEKLSWEDAKHTLKDLRLWIHYITYLALGVGVSSLSLFSPTIVQGLGYENLEAQLFTVPPYACAYVVTFAAAMISDRYKARGLVAGTSFVIGAISFIVQGNPPHHPLSKYLLTTTSRPPRRSLQDPVRLPRPLNLRRLRRPPCSLCLGLRQRPLHDGRLSRFRPEYRIHWPRTDHRCLDLPSTG